MFTPHVSRQAARGLELPGGVAVLVFGDMSSTQGVIPSSSGALTGCCETLRANFRLISDFHSCRRTENRTTWDHRGLTKALGSPDPREPTGATVAAGSNRATDAECVMVASAATSLVGATGAQGPWCNLGSAAPTGPIALIEQTTAQRATGIAGTPGPISPAGAQGQTGQSGPACARGATGSRAAPSTVAGQVGATRLVGPAASTGPAGPTGAMWPTGDTAKHDSGERKCRLNGRRPEAARAGPQRRWSRSAEPEP